MLDKPLFESVFRNHFRELCLYALNYVKDFEISREIVQDGFIRLWEKRDTIDPSKPVKAYMKTVIRNRCLNYLRDNKKFNTGLFNLDELPSEEIFGQSDKLVEEEIRTKIGEAIGELPGKCREIFVLNRYENLKYQEIADRLNISIKTVETQMSKALSHIRNRLKEFITVLWILWMIIG